MSKSSPYENESHEIAVLIKQTDLLITKIRRREVRTVCATPAWIGTLYFISTFEKPPTMKQLLTAQNRSNSSLVAIINRMEREGMVAREQDINNKRYTRVRLTKKGKNLLQKAISLNSFGIIMSSLKKEELIKLKSYLQVLYEASSKLLSKRKNHHRKAR